jgi:hypothetical protein
MVDMQSYYNEELSKSFDYNKELYDKDLKYFREYSKDIQLENSSLITSFN